MTIYGYARESTQKQELGLAAQITELRKSGCDEIVEDFGQSGETNLIESSAWKSIADKITSGDTLRVWAQSRLGRENYEVSFVIGRLVKSGVTVHILETGQVIDNMDDFGQNATMTLKALTDHSERIEIRKRTRKGLQVKKDHGGLVGRKPAYGLKQITEMKRLRAEGCGYGTIGKLVQWKDANGRPHVADPKTVKAALSDEYVTREEWEATNESARIAVARVRA